MTNPEHIDDELLSAYLDNELAPEERARVEERIAADPAARQLLEQLRSVSQAVKDLPAAPLGVDIRDVVLRRAERAMLVSLPGESAAADGNSLRDTVPRFTIGRSLRGWVWAGIATAAALAIMAFESNPNHDAQLPESVAQRRTEPTDEAKSSPEIRALVKAKQEEMPSEPAVSPSPAPTAAPPAGAAISVIAGDEKSAHGTHDDVAKLSRAAAVTPQATAGGQLSIERDKELSVSAGVSAGATPSGNSAAAGAAGEPSEIAADNLLVVRVQLKPDAFEGRAFDRLLKSKGIAFEESSDESDVAAAANGRPQRAEGRGGGRAQGEASRSASESLAPGNSPTTSGVEMALSRQSPPQSGSSPANSAASTDFVLVEAPKEQIESCLAEIHKDDHNYLAVAVDEDETLERKTKADARGGEWTKYVRGVVPQQEKLQQGADSNYFIQTKEGPVTIDRGMNRGANAQPAERERGFVQGEMKLSDQNGRAGRVRSQPQQESMQQSNRGNARALRLDSNRGQQTNANTRLGFAGSDNKEIPSERPGQQAADTLQVLFVLSPGDEPAASPPPVETKAAK